MIVIILIFLFLSLFSFCFLFFKIIKILYLFTCVHIQCAHVDLNDIFIMLCTGPTKNLGKAQKINRFVFDQINFYNHQFMELLKRKN